MPEFIVILQSCWCSESGSGVGYSWDGDRFSTREKAIEEGFTLRGSDDFNIGVVEGDRLLSFDWMQEPVGDDAQTIEEIAQAIGLCHIDRGERAQAQEGQQQ